MDGGGLAGREGALRGSRHARDSQSRIAMDTKQVNVQKDIPNLRKIPCLRYVPPPRLGLYITAMDAKKPTGTWQQAQILNGNLAKLPVKTTTHMFVVLLTLLRAM